MANTTTPPAGTVSWTSSGDPQEALGWFRGLLEAEPTAMSVIGSVTEALVERPDELDGARWWAGRAGDEVVAAAMHTPPHLLHVALATDDAARALADHLHETAHVPPGAGGRREPVVAFAQRWSELTGAQVRTTMEVGLYDLPRRPALPFEVPGRPRVAEDDDLPVVARWMESFHDSVGGDHGRPPDLRPHVADGRVLLWEDDGEPVSVAYASTAHGGVTRISGVWTPVERRGRGYASAVVAALSNDRMDRGQSCMLFTDLANPTSNGIYQAIGYRRVGDNVTVEFA